MSIAMLVILDRARPLSELAPVADVGSARTVAKL